MLHETPEMRSFITGRRSITVPMRVGQMEHRSKTNELVLTGMAAVFEERSELLYGCFYEEIARGAFRKALAKKPDVRFMYDHEGLVLGRTASGTLDLAEAPTGLEYTVRMSGDIQQARDLYAACERGDVSQSSFTFTVAMFGDSWAYGAVADPDYDGDGEPRLYDLRRITEIAEVYDVSAVGIPAYPAATVSARNSVNIAQLRESDLVELACRAADQRAAVTTPTPGGAEGDPEAGLDEQREGEGNGQQLPPDGPSDDATGSEPGPTAAARARELDLLRNGAHRNVADRTAGDRH